MATIGNAYEHTGFRVIHPLDDIHEEKCSSAGLGHIRMTRSVKISLAILRGYLILMTIMLVYHVLDLGGVLHKLP